MAEPELESPRIEPEEVKPQKENTKRPYKRKHETKKLAEIQNKYDNCYWSSFIIALLILYEYGQKRCSVFNTNLGERDLNLIFFRTN